MFNTSTLLPITFLWAGILLCLYLYSFNLTPMPNGLNFLQTANMFKEKNFVLNTYFTNCIAYSVFYSIFEL